jgi:hypothetical protein
MSHKPNALIHVECDTHYNSPLESSRCRPGESFAASADRFHVERENRREGRQTLLPQDVQGRIALIPVSDQRR